MLVYIAKVRTYKDGIRQAHIIDDNLVENVITTDTPIISGTYYGLEDVNVLTWRAYSERAWNTLRA